MERRTCTVQKLKLIRLRADLQPDDSEDDETRGLLLGKQSARIVAFRTLDRGGEPVVADW